MLRNFLLTAISLIITIFFIEFIIENLKELESNLSKINVPLTVITSKYFDNCTNLIMDVVNQRSINKVYWNNQFGYDEQKRDTLVKEILNKNNVFNESFDDQVVYSPGTIKTMEGKPYSVFTPFKRRWIENFDMDFLDIEFKYIVKKESKARVMTSLRNSKERVFEIGKITKKNVNETQIQIL